MPVGYHIIADFFGISSNLLDDIEKIDKIFTKACKISNFNVISKSYKKFEPYGVTIVYCISESHISIHTWPEKNLATLDIFTCTDKESCYKAYNYIKEAFSPKKVKEIFIERGSLDE